MRTDDQYKKGVWGAVNSNSLSVCQILDLVGKDFKAAIINTSEELKETTFLKLRKVC